MKILCVIPARAGSKGIPNKNIRIVAGYPLIYYAIRNALSSEHITDIVVSTDSPVIAIIAEQMGVKCHWRDEKLCGDAITLDAVIADAARKYNDLDYIITMQPTSPTLKTQTLDCAIEYALEYGVDTLISAINAPRLTWGIKDGRKVPNYRERLNRQYLPPCYLETGAFVISRAAVVTENTRIGKVVDVFEVSEHESVDIDNFTDLCSVTAILENQKVGIYVNGNNGRGVGHIYRALELADEFFVKPDIYYDSNQTGRELFGETTHNLIPVNGIAELFEYCKQNRYGIFINDILATTIDYMIALKGCLPENAKIINFEDDGEGIAKADLVFNALYSTTDLPHVYVGEKYYIPGKTFMFYDPILLNDKVTKAFISFGGADPQNYSDRLLTIIAKPEYKDYRFLVVLGRAKQNVDRLMDYNKYSNIKVLFDIPNMAQLMCECDIGVTSRGRTGYELALLGIPSIAMAQNRREEKHEFVCNENGFTYLGLNPSDETIESSLKAYLTMSKEHRQRLQNMLLSHDLRDGRRRVMALINA